MMSLPDFRLYWSNALNVLARLLAEELRVPAQGQSLLAPEIILIPQAAMRRWLQAELAQAYGIAANLEFLTPGEFVRRALDANVPGQADDLNATGLGWRVYAALSDLHAMRDPALRTLAQYLDGGDPLRAWSLAQELAATFEKYQAWRRDWLLAWEAGAEPHDAQAALWRRIAAGKQHRARRIDAYLRAHGSQGSAIPNGLPTRLFAFATVNISPDVLRVIATQARVGTLHCYVPTPSRNYWGDLRTWRERFSIGQEAQEPAENPLLQAWGAAGRDFMAMLGDYETVHPSSEHAHYADPEATPDDAPERDTLLGRLQRDVLHRRSPRAWRARVDKGDVSLQLHACHTPLREVQVLHDRLRALLDDPRFDPPLQPREIAVLAPDIDAYAPAISAVFGGAAGDLSIPWTLADTSPLASEPLAEAFLRLLALPLSRFGVHDVLDLLASPAIAEAAALDADDFDRLRHWLGEAGARWGLDAAHRAHLQAPRDAAGTWRFGLDRLLLGYASGEEADIAGVASWPDLEGTALQALDTLIRLLRVLARSAQTLAEPATPAQWRERLFALLEVLLPRPPAQESDRKTLERLRGVIDEFARSAEDADFDAPIAPEIVRAHFSEALRQADTRAPLLSGGVSFGRMVPMRLIPFRVLCVLGMNDGDYPRRDPAGGLNRIGHALGTAERRIGDRSLREDDRHLFLQLFTAAGEVFYASYIGADPRDGSAREPSMLIAELLDAAVAYHHGTAAAVRADLVLHHPLQPFCAQAFGDTSDPRYFSYQRQWHPAASGSGIARQIAPPWLATPLSPSVPAQDRTLALEALRAGLIDPAKHFLRARMQMRLPDIEEARDDTEPLQLPGHGWQRAQWQREVFDACARGQTSGLAEHLRARGLLPSGALGEALLQDALPPLQALAQAVRQWREAAVPSQPLTLQWESGGLWLQGQITQWYPHGLLRWHSKEPGGRAQINDGLDWLLLCATGHGVPMQRFYLTAGGRVSMEPQRAPIPALQAQAALRVLLWLYTDGQRLPLPFGAGAGWEWYRRRILPRPREQADPWEQAEAVWHATRGWSEGDTEAARLALRGRDPFVDPQAGEQFRCIARLVFDAVRLGEVDAPTLRAWEALR